MTKRQSQSIQILMALLAGDEVSTIEITGRFHCVDGRKRLSELRRMGYNIEWRWVKQNNVKFKKHFIPKERIFFSVRKP